jgi:aminoglycoside 6'-N-acetyltransferase I
MRLALWPDATREDIEAQIRTAPPGAAFLAVDESESPAGFLEINLRAYAEGCESSPVPHIEAWYVAPQSRRRGVGRVLMQAAQAWALANGYNEMTSDTNESYPLSPAAHAANGFREVERLICFHKKLR